MLISAMHRLLRSLLVVAVGLAPIPFVSSQDMVPGVDLLYPEISHPEPDANAAIATPDSRIINIEPHA